jgi:hypothetical protein
MDILIRETLEKSHTKSIGIFIAHDKMEEELADENLC